MHIPIERVRDEKDLTGHIVVEALAHSTTEIEKAVEDGGCEVIITVNGVEANLEEIINGWQGQMTRMIKEKAAEVISSKLDSLDHVIKGVRVVLDKEGLLPDEDLHWW